MPQFLCPLFTLVVKYLSICPDGGKGDSAFRLTVQGKLVNLY